LYASCFSLMLRPPPSSTLFPYTTLFRSLEHHPTLIRSGTNIQQLPAGRRAVPPDLDSGVIYEVVEVLEFVGVEVVGSDPAIFFCGPGLALVSLNLSTRISQFGGIHATHCLQGQVPDLRIESFIGVHRLDRFPDDVFVVPDFKLAFQLSTDLVVRLGRELVDLDTISTEGHKDVVEDPALERLYPGTDLGVLDPGCLALTNDPVEGALGQVGNLTLCI